MARTGSALVTGAMRAGYAARGFVYLIVGSLAIAAAARGGPAEGFLGSLDALKGQPWNKPVLFALAAGLLLYAIWRGLDCTMDLAGHGRGFGRVERFGLSFVAVLNLLFAWYALRLAIGGSWRPGKGGRFVGVVADLIQHPLGRWFVALAGIGTISLGAYSVWKGLRGRYLSHLRPSRLVRRAVPLLAFGLIARGLVFWVMGGFIVWAAWNFEPQAAGGFGDALERIHRAVYGRVLLGIVGAGLVAFSLYCFVEAAFRVLPRRKISGR